VTQGSSRLGPRPFDQAVNGGSGRVVTLELGDKYGHLSPLLRSLEALRSWRVRLHEAAPEADQRAGRSCITVRLAVR
jgi:hypothetical protein